jgi:RNA polymerase sigma-70 factor, ECF subfamily
LQEVYLRIFQHIDQFEDRGPTSFLNWAYTILDHELIDVRRAAHRRGRDIAREVASPRGHTNSGSYWNLLDQVCADSGTPSRVVRRQEALGALLECVDELSEAHRDVVQLRFLDGLPLFEVAARLGKTEAAVVALTQRALHALREALERRGDFTRNG